MIEERAKQFRNYTDRINAIDKAIEMFNWDIRTSGIKDSVKSLSKYIGILSQESFQMKTSKEMENYIVELEKCKDKLDEITLAQLRLCKKEFDSKNKIPKEDIRTYAELVAKSGDVWKQAKESNNYNLFSGNLDEIIKYNIKFANYIGYKDHIYNALLDDYEPGMTVEKLDVFFSEIKKSILPLLEKIKNSKVKLSNKCLGRKVTKEQQEKVAKLLIKALGYDLNRGILKESEHPFAMSFGKNDVRITTHYIEDDILASFYSVAHELGHALYEQNSKDIIANTILDAGISMGIHESQSRFYENMICRSYEFLELVYDDLMNILGDDFKDISLQQIYECANLVETSTIRIYADEVTYLLHIMIRYEIEKDLLTGNYDINKLPDIWNSKVKEYLGITIKNDGEGILQDIHWAAGLFGYFPTYALGSAYAAQFLHYINQDLNVYDHVKDNNIEEITTWLKKNIHQYGSIKLPEEIVRSINDEGLNASYLINYLEDKYSKLYKL